MTENKGRKQKVLFICTNNSARSQMAEGLINHDLGDRFEAFSAGAKPTALKTQAVQVMAELGIDISGAKAKHLVDFDGGKFDHVITLCSAAAEACPVFIGRARQVHLGFEDPAAAGGGEEEVLEKFRQVRDQIREKVEAYLVEDDQRE